MDTKSLRTVQTAAQRGLLLVALTISLTGCKTTPVNPFAAREKADQAEKEGATAQKDDPQKDLTDPTVPDLAKSVAELRDEVETAAKDTSQQARLAVAQTLGQAAYEGKQVAAHTVSTAQDVALQANADVQHFAFDSIAQLPLEQAGPMLLLAIAEGSADARQAAAAQLAERWPPSANFPVEEAAENRATAIAALRQLWIKQYGEINDAAVAARAAAQQLTAQSADGVRQAKAAAVESTDSAMRIAYTAINSASAEIRRQSCEYLAAHGDPRHALVLLPLLEDPDQTVVVAAVRALGAVGTLEDPQPLVRLLNVPDKQVRVEAAMSLAHLRVVQGVQALERMGMDTDVQVRLRAAQAMGQIANPAFVPALMAMLGDAVEVQTVAMISLAQVAGTDPTAQDGNTSVSQEERIRLWQVWYREYQDRPVSRR